MSTSETDIDALRERARSRWIRPDDWTPEIRSAVEEMMVGTAPERIEMAVEAVTHVPVRVLAVGGHSVILAGRGNADVKSDEGLPSV
jgi:hypothetical protein